ncbi:hypothetical protein K491DRAFT_189214 [Lophiostoma macrostomum CBS 122681]|uniref:Uncharacterized protein n=1 Tax=Lophiostoma macrostomum CBS 122681 TaxID=1314788 RepID=A0A6A6TRH4_9PLEO|nr:hypothetical protein K491DRAFT_189214 [Lophiostoma macrostomum CBS 122681]
MPVTMSAVFFIVSIFVVVLSAAIHFRTHQKRARAAHKGDSDISQEKDKKQDISRLSTLRSENTSCDRGTSPIMPATPHRYPSARQQTDTRAYSAAIPSRSLPFSPSESTSAHKRLRTSTISTPITQRRDDNSLGAYATTFNFQPSSSRYYTAPSPPLRPRKRATSTSVIHSTRLREASTHAYSASISARAQPSFTPPTHPLVPKTTSSVRRSTEIPKDILPDNSLPQDSIFRSESWKTHMLHANYTSNPTCLNAFNPVTTKPWDNGMQLPVTKYGLKTEPEVGKEVGGGGKGKKRFRIRNVLSNVKQCFVKKTTQCNDTNPAKSSAESVKQDPDWDAFVQEKNGKSGRKEGLSRLRSISQKCHLSGGGDEKEVKWRPVVWGPKANGKHDV